VEFQGAAPQQDDITLVVIKAGRLECPDHLHTMS
jgi:hypothetical protein